MFNVGLKKRIFSIYLQKENENQPIDFSNIYYSSSYISIFSYTDKCKKYHLFNLSQMTILQLIQLKWNERMNERMNLFNV